MKDVLSQQALRVLEPAVGKGNVAVSVNLSLDFDKQTVSKVEFAPPVEGEANGLLRSSQELYNAVASSSGGAAGVAGTVSNGTGNPAYVAGTPQETSASAPAGSYTRTYNYELNQVQTQIQKAQGAVKNLTVAVLVNSSVKGVDAYTDNVRNLVAKAIGVTPDHISVELLPFAANNEMETAFKQNQDAVDKLSQRKMIVNIVEVIAVAAAVIVIVRLLFRRPSQSARKEPATAAANGRMTEIVGVTPDDFAEDEAEEEFDRTDLFLKKSSEAEKIEDLMDRYPETVAQILRSWLRRIIRDDSDNDDRFKADQAGKGRHPPYRRR